MVDMVVYIIFILMLVFVVAYYSSFEYCRYKMAKMLAAGLGGKAVFKLGWSYMSRSYEGLEERVWIVPDDKMAWGSLRSIFLPPMGKLFLWREKTSTSDSILNPRQACSFVPYLWILSKKPISTYRNWIKTCDYGPIILLRHIVIF